jgi:hypothetical protein
MSKGLRNEHRATSAWRYYPVSQFMEILALQGYP